MIIGFGMLRNELENGNLENWFRCMNICDHIYIFDQNSDDGSLEYYKKFNNCVVIESPINRFEEEVVCKQELLTKIQQEHPDTDWIFWLDGDTILDGRLLVGNSVKFLNSAKKMNYDGIRLGHLNLWRSDWFYRIDNLYDYFDNVGRVPFWRNNESLKFNVVKGLHQQQNEMPLGINRILDIKQYKLIHRGFATDEQIIKRYNLYKSLGQEGWALERLLDEETLDVKEINMNILPQWFNAKNVSDPRQEEKICKKI